MNDSGHSSIYSGRPMRSMLDMDSDSAHSSSSNAMSDSDFGDFGAGFGANYSGTDSVGTGTDNEYDIDHLRMKNVELKRELRRVQEKYEAQGKILSVTTRKEELAYSFLPGPRYTLAWHFSCRGLEYTQLMWWIARDQAWVIQDIPIALGFGVFSLVWASVQLVRSVEARAYSLTASSEIANAFARLLWAIGMFIWMSTTVRDLTATNHDIYTPAGTPNRLICSVVLFAAGILQFGQLCTRIRGWKIVPLPDEAVPVAQAVAMKPFEEPRIRAKFYYLFGSFRDWENAAQFLLIGRDLAASLNWQTWWVAWCICNYACVVFLLTVTFNTRKAVVDHLHYVAYTGWLLGTFTHQMSHMFFKGMLNPWPYFYPRRSDSELEGNYFANVILLVSYIPIAVYMFYWVSVSLCGCIPKGGDSKEMVAWDRHETDLEHDYQQTHQRIEPDRIEENWLGTVHFGINMHSLNSHFLTSPPPPPLPRMHTQRAAANRQNLKPV